MKIPNVEQIAAQIGFAVGVSLDELRGPERSQRILLARRVITCLAKGQGFSYPDIAQVVRGKRAKHATIIKLHETGQQCPLVLFAVEAVRRGQHLDSGLFRMARERAAVGAKRENAA